MDKKLQGNIYKIHKNFLYLLRTRVKTNTEKRKYGLKSIKNFWRQKKFLTLK